MATWPTDYQAGQDVANYQEAMKEHYADDITYTIPRKSKLYKYLDNGARKKNFRGKYHLFPVLVRSGESVAAGPDGGYLVDSSADLYQDGYVYNKHNYLRIMASNIAEAQSKGAGAWASVKQQSMKVRKKDFVVDINRQLHGAGWGVLCEVKTGSNSTTLIPKVQGDTFGTDVGEIPPWARYLRPGMKIAWGTKAELITNSSASGYGVVTSEGREGSTSVTITTTAGTAPAADDYVVRNRKKDAATQLCAGDPTTGNGANSVEVMGLAGIYDEDVTTFQGINGSTYSEWLPKNFTNPASAGTPRALEQDHMSLLCDYLDDYTTGGCDVLMMHTSTRRAYVNMLKDLGQEEFTPTELIPGFKGKFLAYHHDDKQIPLMTDRYCLPRRIYGLSKSAVKKFVVKKFQWDTSNGGVWKWVQNYDQVEAFGKFYFNLGVYNRRGCATIDDILVTDLTEIT